MKQKEIWFADLEPIIGSEQRKTRPVVIISGDSMNNNFSVVIACPLSSVIKNFEGCFVIPKSIENGLSADSEIITFQVRSISKSRLKSKIGSISDQQLQKTIEGLNDVLMY